MPESIVTQSIPAPERLENSPSDAVNEGVNRSNGRAGHQKIAEIAFSLWQERGCPYGSPEEDWYQAERLASSNLAEEAVQ